MNCPNCGCEIKENENVCGVCGYNLEVIISDSPVVEESSKLPKKKQQKILGVFAIAIFLVLLIVGGIAVLVENDIISFQSDEKQLVGTWQMDTSSFQSDDWIDTLGNLDGVITEITFMSDGTCIVEGTSSPENGEWSIVDNQLKVVGTVGGMFWNYDGFIVNYDLDGDELEIYDDNHQYSYYKQ